MQSVMISIQPVWVEKILSREKTVEVRKSKPRLEVPFKCYVYCTQADRNFDIEKNSDVVRYQRHCKRKGKVVAEFLCDRIDFIANLATDKWELLQGNVHEQHKRLISGNACLTEEQCISYGGKYAWHISDLVVYNEPRELREFYVERVTTTDSPQLTKLNRPPQSWCYVESANTGGAIN